MNKKDPIFKWHEKLLMYFVALVVIAFLIIIGNIREQNEIEDKIQECYQFLEEHESPTN
tara:strand:- start:248 stop:424 length:177 start_codon:yes stop_codon:yes gene_type:complete